MSIKMGTETAASIAFWAKTGAAVGAIVGWASGATRAHREGNGWTMLKWVAMGILTGFAYGALGAGYAGLSWGTRLGIQTLSPIPFVLTTYATGEDPFRVKWWHGKIPIVHHFWPGFLLAGAGLIVPGGLGVLCSVVGFAAMLDDVLEHSLHCASQEITDEYGTRWSPMMAAWYHGFGFPIPPKPQVSPDYAKLRIIY
jgi:hypothetical protein